MIDKLVQILGEPTIIKGIMIIICSSILFLTISSLIINYLYWFLNGYKNILEFIKPHKNNIIEIKFDIYIVGYPSGEIFYADEKRINKLKKRRLIEWNCDISRYIFKDKNVEMIKKLISPLIMIYNTK